MKVCGRLCRINAAAAGRHGAFAGGYSVAPSTPVNFLRSEAHNRRRHLVTGSRTAEWKPGRNRPLQMSEVDVLIRLRLGCPNAPLRIGKAGGTQIATELNLHAIPEKPSGPGVALVALLRYWWRAARARSMIVAPSDSSTDTPWWARLTSLMSVTALVRAQTSLRGNDNLRLRQGWSCMHLDNRTSVRAARSGYLRAHRAQGSIQGSP
ncbi:hypothetical protein C8T65DRAFT_24131 [Cerioporus squamosus]|nr:hypothetical protein C8T65DRAFT_24131 [Cerioporus squamosus]